MSRLGELIAELSPNGVEYRLLGEVAHYAAETMDAEAVDSRTYVGVDNLLPEKRGKTDSVFVPSGGRLTRFQEGDVLIGNIRPYLKKTWLATHDGGASGDVLVIRSRNRCVVLPEFLFCTLSSDSFFLYDTQHAKGAKMPRGDKSAVMKYRIPVPPLPIQREVARVLDVFTELTADLIAELAAELAARKRQYEYYRNLLLTFDDSVRWTTLGEVCSMKAGKFIAASEISSTKTAEYRYPCFGVCAQFDWR